MTQVTLTLTTNVEIARAILDLLEHPQAPEADDQPTDSQLAAFVESLSENCREVVLGVVALSMQGNPILRSALLQSVVFGETRPDDGQLNGVIGTVGKRWSQFVSGHSNPFVARRAGGSEWQYQIEQQLAIRIEALLSVGARRWRASNA